MSSPWFDKCCICFPISVGARILGSLMTMINAIACLISFLLTVDMTCRVNEMVKLHRIIDAKMNFFMNLYYLFCVIYSMKLILSFYLLLGFFKNQKKYIQKFYRAYSVFMGLCFIRFGITICLNAEHYPKKGYMIDLVIDVVIMGIEIYFIFVLKRLYAKMKAKESVQLSVVYTTSTKPKEDEV